MTVVGEQATDGDTQGGIISHRSAQEGDRGSGSEVSQDLNEGNTGVVIDSDMDIFPTAVKLAAAATIGTNNHAGEASQLLNIEVEEIARRSVLITDQRHSGLQIAHAVQPQAAKNAADSSPAQACGLGNMEAGEALSPQLFHALRQRLPGATWRTMRREERSCKPANPSC